MMEEISKNKKDIPPKLEWIKDPYNLAFISILVLSLLIRLYYFWITKSQPLWWDEAEYMLKAKSFFLDTPTTGWAPEREVVVPIFWGVLYYFTHSEFFPRFFQVFVSSGIVLMVYLLGKELFNKKIALVASLIISVNAVMLFFTGRLLTYLWAPLFFLLTFYFFWKGYIKKEKRVYLYLAPIMGAIGLVTYGSLAFGILGIFLFLLITKQHKMFFDKDLWIMAGIGLLTLVPQFIYSKLTYGSAVSRWSALHSTLQNPNLSYFFGYFKIFPHMFGWIFTAFMILGGIYSIYILVISFDHVIKGKNNFLNALLFVVLWIITIIAFYTYVAIFYGGVIYDAFVMPIFPALALLAGLAADILTKLEPKYKKQVLTVIIFLLLLGAFYQVSYSNKIIDAKLDSYGALKEAGFWLKENTSPEEKIITHSVPQITYYSEREAFAPSNSKEAILQQFLEIQPSYFVDSVYEATPDYVREFAYENQNSIRPLKIYYLDLQGTQPSLIIYNVELENF